MLSATLGERPRPLAPFDAWPIQLFSPELGTFAWFARPAVFVTQSTQTVATLAHAQLVARAMDHVFARFSSDIELHGGLLILHDWRSVEDFASEARHFYIKRIESYRKGSQRGAIVAINKNPIVRVILQLSAIAMPFRTGHVVELTSDPTPVLAQQNIEPVYGQPFAALSP